MRLIVIDDESSLRKTLRLTLESMGHRVVEASSADGALKAVSDERFDLALVDLRLGRDSGLDLLPRLAHAAPGLGVIIMTAYAAIDSAVESMRSGAFDYLPKPFTPGQLRLILERFSQVRGLQAEVSSLREQVRAVTSDIELESDEPVVRAALDVVARVAPTDAAVLLRGPSGTGKGVFARLIHARSRRATAPFVVVHCPSLSADLLESELFGHAKGAFTGASESTEGKVAAADGGTLFLDEIGDLPIALQPKLLRFVQDKSYERVGESRPRSADVRIIAATNRPLEAEVAEGRFREDLLYRLNVIEIALPALRDRPRDLPRIADRLLEYFAWQLGRPNLTFSADARDAMARYAWPGNLRELRNAIERSVILSPGDEIGSAHLPAPLRKSVELGQNVTLEELEAEHIRRVLLGCVSLDDAAQVLGIDASTLYRKRRKLGLL